MRKVEIPKRSEGTRTIYIPNPEEKSTLRSIVGQLAKKAERLCPDGVVHGFTRFKSPVTNAQAHIGHKFVTCFDLKDFFDTVTEPKLKGKLKQEELALVLVDGAARQGLPTSPAVANIAAADMDHAILKWRDKKKLQVIYTRYADDLTFSYDDDRITQALLCDIPQIVRRCGFTINPKKTHTTSSAKGRHVITGVAVDNQGIHPTRRMKRKLRAAVHQGNQAQARGLAEWCALKPPITLEKATQKQNVASELESLCKTWRLPKINTKYLPDKTNEDLGSDCIITGDPVYMLGMSTWTNGWTSCMSQPKGQYRKGVISWIYLRGTRLAAYLSEKTKVVAGVERRVMRARSLVHELRDGTRIYDRIYGNPGDIEHLKAALESAGCLSVGEVKKTKSGTSVVGHVSAKYPAYLDNLKAITTTAKTGLWAGKKVKVLRI